MPRGLDGNPNPIRSEARERLLQAVVQAIRAVAAPFVCVGIDGPAGSGKSTFADEVAHRLERAGVPAVRSTTDSFHNPRAVRYRRGRWSPEGYYCDSHNLEAIRTMLLNPFRHGQPFRTALFDEAADQPVDVPTATARPGSVLLLDGLFLNRPELRSYWHYCIYLAADRRLRRAGDGGAAAEPAASRYTKGWELYLAECSPLTRADLVVDNDDFAAPFVIQ